MEIAINRCFGGFRLSDVAYEWLIENRGWKVGSWNKNGDLDDKFSCQLVECDYINFGKYHLNNDGINQKLLNIDEGSKQIRLNKDIIDCIKALGKRASSSCSDIKIIEIPTGVDFTIEEYDGLEHIAEVHRTWQ